MTTTTTKQNLYMVYHRKMDKTQKKRYEYITTPATMITALIWIIWVAISRTTLNNRVQNLEEFKSEVNIVELQRDIQDIKTNVAWLTKLMTDYIK